MRNDDLVLCRRSLLVTALWVGARRASFASAPWCVFGVGCLNERKSIVRCESNAVERTQTGHINSRLISNHHIGIITHNSSTRPCT